MNKLKNFAGFTLIELLVVIVIIGILSTISVSTFNGYFEKARLAKAQHAYSQSMGKIKRNIAISDNFNFIGLFSFNGDTGVSQSAPYSQDSTGLHLFTGIEGPGNISKEINTPLKNGAGIRLANKWIIANNYINLRKKITIGGWIKINKINQPYGYPFGYFTRTGFILNNTGSMSFYFGGANISSPNNIIKNNAWHYVLGSYDEETIRLWIDGELIKEKNIAVNSINAQVFHLGHYTTMDVSLDDIFIVNAGFDGENLK